MQPRYILDETVHAITPLRLGHQVTLEIDGHLLDARLQWQGDNQGELIVNGSARRVYFAQDGNALYIHFAGKTWHIEAQDEFSSAGGNDASAGQIRAPMPGVVVENNITQGDTVELGQNLLLIESMKLQTEIKSSVAGIVRAIGFSQGDNFDKGAVLVDIELAVTPGEE